MAIDKVPLTYSLKLGMAQDGLEKKLGAQSVPTFHFAGGGRRSNQPRVTFDAGDRTLTIQNQEQQSKMIDPRITVLDLHFFEGRLYEISVYGGPKIEWRAGDALAYFEKRYGVPKDAWIKDPDTVISDSMIAVCDGVKFGYTASAFDGAVLSLTDSKVEVRVKAAVEAARAAALKN